MSRRESAGIMAGRLTLDLSGFQVTSVCQPGRPDVCDRAVRQEIPSRVLVFLSRQKHVFTRPVAAANSLNYDPPRKGNC